MWLILLYFLAISTCSGRPFFQVMYEWTVWGLDQIQAPNHLTWGDLHSRFCWDSDASGCWAATMAHIICSVESEPMPPVPSVGKNGFTGSTSPFPYLIAIRAVRTPSNVDFSLFAGTPSWAELTALIQNTRPIRSRPVRRISISSGYRGVSPTSVGPTRQEATNDVGPKGNSVVTIDERSGLVHFNPQRGCFYFDNFIN